MQGMVIKPQWRVFTVALDIIQSRALMYYLIPDQLVLHIVDIWVIEHYSSCQFKVNGNTQHINKQCCQDEDEWRICELSFCINGLGKRLSVQTEIDLLRPCTNVL